MLAASTQTTPSRRLAVDTNTEKHRSKDGWWTVTTSEKIKDSQAVTAFVRWAGQNTHRYCIMSHRDGNMCQKFSAHLYPVHSQRNDELQNTLRQLLRVPIDLCSHSSNIRADVQSLGHAPQQRLPSGYLRVDHVV